MKTHKNLYILVTNFENLYQAFKKAARGKRSRPDVAAFEYDLEANLLALQEELESQTYTPGSYYNFHIQDPKPRLISAAPFRDRVVHHALVRNIEPIFERRFIHDSYACRKGKGTHKALDRCQHFARKYRYVLKCDLVHFFPTIDHAILRAQLARVIADPCTMWLVDQIIDSGTDVHASSSSPHYFPQDDPSTGSGQGLFAAMRPRGLPIGNLTSQFWANVYLNPLDQFIKRELKCGGYVRYVDDFLLFADDKPSLHRWKRDVIRFAATLRARLHERESVVFPVHTGIPFLGWRVYPEHRRLKRRNGVAFQRRFARLVQEYAGGQISWEQMNASVQSWIAHASHGDTWGLRESILSSVVLPSVPSQPPSSPLGRD
ncbi:MAG: RNA-dependent DNA polymerase [Chloroflexi bacterium]|nr:RNA-dependent DNA polymerase [Chloroflexota bacterium]